MLPYIFLLLFIVIWIWIIKKQFNSKSILIPGILLVIFGTIRSVEIGTDSEMYSRVFNDNIDPSSFVFDERLEFGYSLLIYIIQHIDKEYYLLFFFTSILIVFNSLYAIKKNSQDFILSVYIYITFGFFTFYFNTLRQAIAMSIILLGTHFLLNKKIIPYSIVVFIAFLFHRSAVIMLIFYFLVHFIKMRIEYKAVISFLISTALASSVLVYMASINDKYSGYVEESDKAGGYSYILLYSIIGILLMYFGRKIRNTNRDYNIYEQVYVCGVCFCIPLILLGTNPSGPKRVIYYFLMYLMFIFPILFKRYPSILLRGVFFAFSFMYFIYITYNIWEIYPYRINPIFDFL